jgi:hypothetical protein
MTAEEIRIRSLVSIRTGEDLTYNIPKRFAFYGLYPEAIRIVPDSYPIEFIDELETEEFKQKIEAWPDVKAAVKRYERKK